VLRQVTLLYECYSTTGGWRDAGGAAPSGKGLSRARGEAYRTVRPGGRHTALASRERTHRKLIPVWTREQDAEFVRLFAQTQMMTVHYEAVEEELHKALMQRPGTPRHQSLTPSLWQVHTSPAKRAFVGSS